MKTRMLTFIAATALAFSHVAHAQGVPETLHITARIVESGAAATGAHGFAFRLYTTATGGEPVWKEDDVTLAVQDGLLHRELGTLTPLRPDVVNGGKLYLEMVIDGVTLQPRLAITSVAYAMRANVAARAERLGDLAPGDVARVDGDGRVAGGRTADSWGATRTGGVRSTTWTTIPGLDLTIDLARDANVTIHATGEQRTLTTGPESLCHQAYRIVIDDRGLGDPNHGQRIHMSRGDLSWWSVWAISHFAALPPGTHTVRVQTRESGHSDVRCAVCSEHNGGQQGYTECNLNIVATYR